MTDLGVRVPGRHAPVFVLSPPRSCSSVIVAMLGQHPELYGFPELRLLHRTGVRDLLADRAGPLGPTYAAGLLRTLAQLHEGAQTAGAVARAWGWLQEHADWRPVDVLDHVLAAVDPLVGVEKTPETSRSLATLAAMAESYPRARFLHLVRHPAESVTSMIAAWEDQADWRVPRERRVRRCARMWIEQHRNVLELADRIGPDRIVRVRAEDLVNGPGDSLPPLCAWIGIAAGAEVIAAMSRPEESPYAAPGPPGASGGLDPNFLLDPVRRTVAVPDDLHFLTDALPLSEAVEIAELAHLFGYTDHRPVRSWSFRTAAARRQSRVSSGSGQRS